jgi:hypothetical protein
VSAVKDFRAWQVMEHLSQRSSEQRSLSQDRMGALSPDMLIKGPKANNIVESGTVAAAAVYLH